MFDIQENLKKLPDCPGVYLHKDKLGQVIYVGKAISLRNRVRQYFQSAAKQNPKVRAMVSNIAEFEYIKCATEMEALILECNLIKKYMPKYNVLLRDDKTYPYIMVTTTEKYPRVLKTRIIKKDGNKYFGPYSDAGAVNQIVDLLNNVYSLKRCKMQEFPPNHRPCLNYHIKQCKGVCINAVSQEEYRESIDEVLEFLSGHAKKLINNLKDKMLKASEEMRYEEAAKYRDYIRAAEVLSETQRVTLSSDKDLDVVLTVKDKDNSFVVLFYVRDGKLSGRDTFQIQSGDGDSRKEMTAEFLKQYYSQWASVPSEIIVEEVPDDVELLEEFLSREGRKVKIFTPQKGEKKDLLRLAQSDRLEMVKTISEKAKLAEEKQSNLRREISKVLKMAGYTRDPGEIQTSLYSMKGLRENPREYRIESYDISNTNGVDSVGAMVVFEGMQRIRKDYRRFKIKTIKGQDDYGSLEEMLGRRFRRAEKGDPAFAILPDAIFMDGGLGQVHSAKKVLDELGFDIPVIGLAKDDYHRTRAMVFDDGSEILLSEHPLLFKYAGTIQEEVHRYAIDYHRKLRNKNAIGSVLDNIEGIGPIRRNALLAKFGSIDNIKKASLEELMSVKGMNEAAAENVVKYFS